MPLETSRNLIDKEVEQLARFKSGELVPLATGVSHLDKALLGGLLPSSVLGIIGPSGHGKTYLYEKLERNFRKNGEDVIIVICNWELELSKLLVRDLSIKLDLTPKQVLFDPITDENKEDFKRVCDQHRIDNVYYQNEPVTPDVFESDINGIIKKYPDKKIVVIIDNLENILIEGSSQKAQMDKLLYKINTLKKVHSFICFVILNQMNREYGIKLHEHVRNHRPSESNIYGTGQLYKLCDVVVAKVLPWKFGLWEEFMHIREGEYEYLDDHKLDPEGVTTSFDPYGKDFYFYLKTRMPENFDVINDIHIETIFERKEIKQNRLNFNSSNGNTNSKIPIFSSDQELIKSVIKPVRSKKIDF